MDFEFRDALPADAPGLAVLFTYVYIHAYGFEGVSTEYTNYIMKQFSTVRIAQTIESFPGLIKLATYNRNPVGVIEIVLNGKCPVDNMVTPEVNKLYVMNNFSGRGIGKKLLRLSEEFLTSIGEKDLWLWVWLPNRKAIQFYEREGYRSLGNVLYEMEANSYENKVMYKKLR